MEDILELRKKLAVLDAERHEIEGRLREMRPPRGPFDKAGRGAFATRERGRGVALNRPRTQGRDRGKEMPPEDGARYFHRRRLDSSREDSRHDDDRGVGVDRDESTRLKRRRDSINEEDEDNDGADDRQRTRPKIMSAIVATGSQARLKSSAILSDDFSLPRNDRTYGPGGSTFRMSLEEELVVAKPEPQAAYKAVETVTRNKRMFGALMGHLGSAQRRLKKDEDVIKKQEQMQQTAAQKSQEEAARLRELQRKLNQEKKEREMQSRDEIVAKKRALEVNLLQVAFKAQQEPLLKFLLTVTEPPLCYVPAQHNDATSAKLKAQKAEIEARIKEREENDAERLRVIALIVPEGIERRRIRREAIRLNSQKVQNGDDGQGEGEADDGDQDEDEDEGEDHDEDGDHDQEEHDQDGEQDQDGAENGDGKLNHGDVGIVEPSLEEVKLEEEKSHTSVKKRRPKAMGEEG